MARTSFAALFSAKPVLALLLCVLLGCSVAPAQAQPPPEPVDPSSMNPGQSAEGAEQAPTRLRLPLLERPGPIALEAPPRLVPSLAPLGGKGPVGYDHYRRMDALAGLPTGTQSLQFSSYDRTGGNDDGFSGTHSCLRQDPSGCVIAERQGAGEIGSIWFTRDAGDVRRTGHIKIELDGRTVLDAPLQDVVDGRLGGPFVYPLVANAEQSSGGVYIKVPMPFRESMRVTTQHNPFFHHVAYRAFADASGVTTFNPAEQAGDVVATLRNAGFRDPKPADPAAQRVATPFNVLGPGQSVTLGEVSGPGSISELRLRIPQIVPGDPVSDDILSRARIRLTFDGVRTVDAPLGEFFGSGLGENEVRSLFHAMETSPDGWYSSWWPMPYMSSARIELANGSAHSIARGESQVVHAPSARWLQELGPTGNAGYFGATARRGEVVPAQDWVFTEKLGRGKFVGLTSTMYGLTEGDGSAFNNYRGYLEGDERVFVDDDLTEPSIHGTGTEDYFEGGWYFNRGAFTNPQNGNPVHKRHQPGCQFSCDTAYRTMITEAIPFQSRFRFGMEHGPHNDMPAIYSTVSFQYTKSPG